MYYLSFVYFGLVVLNSLAILAYFVGGHQVHAEHALFETLAIGFLSGAMFLALFAACSSRHNAATKLQGHLFKRAIFIGYALFFFSLLIREIDFKRLELSQFWFLLNNRYSRAAMLIVAWALFIRWCYQRKFIGRMIVFLLTKRGAILSLLAFSTVLLAQIFDGLRSQSYFWQFVEELLEVNAALLFLIAMFDLCKHRRSI